MDDGRVAIECRVIDRTRRHVVAQDFRAIDVNNRAVIPPEPQRKSGDSGNIRHVERMPKISGDQT